MARVGVQAVNASVCIYMPFKIMTNLLAHSEIRRVNATTFPVPVLMERLLQGSGMGVCLLNYDPFVADQPAYRIIHVNAQFCRITRLKAHAGQTITSESLPQGSEWLELLERVRHRRHLERLERRAVPLSRWLHAEIVPLDSGSQGLIGVLLTDVTPRKRREMDLVEKKLRYRALVDGLPLPVWVLAPDGSTRFVNTIFERFFGCNRSQREKLRWESLLHPEDLPGFNYDLQRATLERSSFTSLVRGRRSDGQWRWLEMSATPRYSGSGRYMGVAGNSRDVTDRRELEQANEQLLRSERAARSAAESTSRLKDEFMATISHELRTPLTTVLGWSELLLQRVEQSDPLYKGLNVITTSAQALKRLIADMLDLSGMLMGKLKLDMEPLDIVEEVQDAVRSLDLAASERQLTIQTDLLTSPQIVMGDRTRIQQVLWNLLSNAAKFTPEGGHVRVGMASLDGRAIIQIVDDGVGIAKEFLPHLFTRFRQADATTTRRYGGLGLGLSIVQQLVELHGGSVSAESGGIGCGAVFTVQIPLVQEGQFSTDNVDDLLPASPPAVGTDSESLANLRLLLVDDQREILEFVRHSLERHGAQVHTASNGADALRLIGSVDHARYDLVISDIGMPGMDGYALAKTIREDMGLPASTLPMIALTALTQPEDRERALSSGFQAHVMKPCNMTFMASEIRRLVQLASL